MDWEGVPSGKVYIGIYRAGKGYADVIRASEENEFVKKLDKKKLGETRLIKAPREVRDNFVPLLYEIQDEDFERLPGLHTSIRDLDSLVSDRLFSKA